MQKRCTGSGWTHSLRESRLLRRDTQDRFRSFEQMEQEEAAKASKPRNPLTALNQEKDRLLQRIVTATNTGWGEWMRLVAPGVARSEKVMRALRKEAQDRIREKYPDLDWNYLWYPFNSGKRRMYYAVQDRMAREMASELQDDLKEKEEELATLEQQFARLRSAFGRGGVRIRSRPKNTRKMQGALTRAAGYLEKQVQSREARGKGMPEAAKRAVEAEKLLRVDLVRYGIAEPEELDDLFEKNARAGGWLDTTLERRIKAFRAKAGSVSVLPGASDRVRRILLDAVKDIQAGRRLWVLWRTPKQWYRSALLAEGNPNASAASFRKFLGEYPAIIGRKAEIEVPGRGRIRACVHARTREGLVELKTPPAKDKPAERILLDPGDDPKAKDVMGVYRDAAGKLREFKTDHSRIRFSLV